MDIMSGKLDLPLKLRRNSAWNPSGNLSFKDLFTCSLCKGHCSKPFYFPCGDILCPECYKQFIDEADADDRIFSTTLEDAYIDCPVCQKRSVAAKNKLAGLNLNIFRNLNLGSSGEPMSTETSLTKMELSVAKKGTISGKCTVCAFDSTEQLPDAAYQCLDCLDILCEQCSGVHKKTRLTKDHEVVKLSDLLSVHVEEERKKRFKIPCLNHPDKPLEVYCLPCSQMLCLQCKLIEHNNHLCTDLSPAAASQRDKLHADCKQINENIRQIEQLINKSTEAKQLARKRRASLVEQMISRVSFFKEQLELYGQTLANQSSEHYRSIIKSIEEDEKGLQEHLSKLTSLKVLTERLLTRGTDVDILSSQHHYNEKYNMYCSKWTAPVRPEFEDLYLNFPTTKYLAVGTLFGYLSRGNPEHVAAASLAMFKDRCPGDDGKLPHISPSGRIYDAEVDLKYGVLNRPVIKADFKACLELKAPSNALVRINLLTLVLGKPKHIFTRQCTPGNGSVIHVASMSNDDIVVAVFLRNIDFNQTRQCTRVRIQVYSTFGQIKLDIAYGAVCYGLAVGKEDQIIASGGQFNKKNIDVIWKDGRPSTNFAPKSEPGGITVDNNGNIVIAGDATIEFYTIEGKFLKSFCDDISKKTILQNQKGFRHVRKFLAFGSDDEVYVADANTNSVRGYNWKGELAFNYGDYGTNVITPVINPRGIAVDSLGHILIGDIRTNSVHIINRNGSLLCKILEGLINDPRSVVPYNSCYIAVGQGSGIMKVYQYLFDKDDTTNNSY